MSVEPAQSNPSEIESKSSQGWMFILALCRDVAQHAQAAALGLASDRPRVSKGQALVFARPSFELCRHCWRAIAVQLLPVRAESPQRTRCPFAENADLSTAVKLRRSMVAREESSGLSCLTPCKNATPV